MPAPEFVKLHIGNDISALAIINLLSPEPAHSPPTTVHNLLHEFKDVFHKPGKLPQARVYDHTIPLLPNTTPMNTKPYRYSSLHKDEIVQWRRKRCLLLYAFVNVKTFRSCQVGLRPVVDSRGI